MPSNAELHGYVLVAGREAWAKLRPNLAARIDIYQKTIEAIARFDVRIYIRGADLATHRIRYGADVNPHRTVLPWVLERVQQDAVRTKDVALVIADEVALPDRYRQDVLGYQQSGTWGWKPETLDRIADTIHFAPSKSSRLLQAADMVSYAHLQSVKRHPNALAQAANERIWSQLTGKVREASCWPR